MNLDVLKEEIKDLNYVVMRNWETMPPDGDIDFFVAPKDLETLANACKKYLHDPKWFDIRTIGDNYFPSDIEKSLLAAHESVDGWKIPIPLVHYVSLMYHGRIHKGDHRYDDKLDEIFFKTFPPVIPEDEGVGYNDGFDSYRLE